MIATKVIGLTGGIATGKSTVSALLKQLGAAIVDADLVARQIVEPGGPAWQEIIAAFGVGFLNLDKTLNREKLGKLVFNDAQALEKLNQITHPKIVEEIRQQIEGYKLIEVGPALLVIDAALLIEVKLHLLVEEVWLVTCSPQEQIARLMVRDKLSYQDALARIKSQMPIEEKKSYAQYIINNNGTLEETKKQVEELWQLLMHRN